MLYGWISTVEICTIIEKLFSAQVGMLSIALFIKTAFIGIFFSKISDKTRREKYDS